MAVVPGSVSRGVGRRGSGNGRLGVVGVMLCLVAVVRHAPTSVRRNGASRVGRRYAMPRYEFWTSSFSRRFSAVSVRRILPLSMT